MTLSVEDTSIRVELQHACKHSLLDKLPMAAAGSNVRQQHKGNATCPMQTEAPADIPLCMHPAD